MIGTVGRKFQGRNKRMWIGGPLEAAVSGYRWAWERRCTTWHYAADNKHCK